MCEEKSIVNACEYISQTVNRPRCPNNNILNRNISVLHVNRSSSRSLTGPLYCFLKQWVTAQPICAHRGRAREEGGRGGRVTRALIWRTKGAANQSANARSNGPMVTLDGKARAPRALERAGFSTGRLRPQRLSVRLREGCSFSLFYSPFCVAEGKILK